MSQVQKATDMSMNVMNTGSFMVVRSVKSGQEFQKVMDDVAPKAQTQVSEPADSSMKSDGSASETSEKGTNDVTEVSKEKLSQSSKPKGIESETLPDEKTVESVMQTLLTSVKQLLMDMFQVSEEELNAFMELTGLTETDLLDPKMLTDMALGLTGTTDKMALLMDGKLSRQVRTLLDTVEKMTVQTQKDFNLSQSEFDKLLASMESKTENEGVEQVVDTQIPEVIVEDSVEKQPNVTKESKEVVTTNEESVQAQTVNPSEQKNADFANNFDSQGKEQKGQNDTLHVQNMDTPQQVLTAVTDAVEQAIPDAEAQQVVRQLVEAIKVSVKPDTTSFEMQLNPEHLGKVNLQVISKDGLITAKLITDNQAVRDMMEAQVQMLKDTLQSQGIKVTSVEVTVASHQFDQNLQQQGKNQEQGQQSAKKRPFRFDVMGVEDEELTQEELMLKEMMLTQGNRINFKA